MNKGELLTLAEGYSHRNDFAALYDAFLNLTEARIAESVRSSELVVFGTIDTDAVAPIVGNAWALPDDFLEMKDVTVTINGGRVVTLRAVGRDEINRASQQTSGGTPTMYNIQDGTIEVRPGPSARTINFTYYGRLTNLVDDTDTNDLLDRYPGVYLYGVLSEVWNWSQNDAEREKALTRMGSEIGGINALSWNQEFGTAPVGSSGYNYSGVGARL